MMIKKTGSIIMCVLLILGTTACSSGKGTVDYSNTSLTGQVIAIDGNTVTIQPGEWAEGEKPDEEMLSTEEGETLPELSDEETASQENGEPPSTREGDAPPEKPSGEAPPSADGSEPMEMPDGEAPSDNADSTDSDQPEGDGSGQQPGGGSGRMVFTASDADTVTFDLTGVTITIVSGNDGIEGTMEDVKAGAVLVLEIGDDNKVTAVFVRESNRGDGAPRQETSSEESGNAADVPETQEE